MGGALAASVFSVLWAAGWVTIRDLTWTSLAATPFALALVCQVLRYFGGAVFEELFSRSYLLRMVGEVAAGAGLDDRSALLLAWVGSALLFGLLHLANPGASVVPALNLSLLGFIFGLPMVLSGHLGPSIGLHVGWNVVQSSVFGLANSGKPSLASLFAIDVTGPGMWTGGSFGPEGGLVATILLVAGTAFAVLWVRYSGCGRLRLSLVRPARDWPERGMSGPESGGDRRGEG